MHTVRYPGIITFTELIIHVGWSDGIAEPPEQLAGKVNDITIMQGNNFALPPWEYIAICRPGWTSLSIRPDGETIVLKQLIEFAECRSGVPNDPCSLRKAGKKFFCLPVLLLSSPSHGYYNLIEIGNSSYSFHNLFYSRRLEFSIGCGKYKSNGIVLIKFSQFSFHTLKVDTPETVESSHYTRLIKVSHSNLLTG